MRLSIAGVALLVLGSATGAADPDAVKEIKEVIADLKVQFAKSEANMESAKAALTALDVEYARKRDAVAVVTKAATEAVEQAAAAPAARVAAARKAVDKADAEAATADVALGAAKDKLKAATDATDVADLKKAVADLTAAADAKRTAAAKARVAAREAAAELAVAAAAAKATADAAVQTGEQIVKLARADFKRATDLLVEAVEERDRVEGKLRKATRRLEELSK